MTATSFFVVIVALFVFKTIIIVPERENVIVERLGKYQRKLSPGFYFLIPFIDKAAY